ncbi:short-chain dehydrogenase [Xylaria flabelliformis]|nr:short-chain dehydrogenase [Xylaria flabelliformis]
MAHHREFARPEKWAYEELPSLTGKVAIVTGANSRDGVGYHTAHRLALAGARVYVGARSQQKADGAIKNMLEDSPSLDAALLKPLVMDLSNFHEVQQVARRFLKDEDRLDILVNNAALLPGPVAFDSNGLSLSFATNYLGPFLFTTELVPLLKATAKQDPKNDVRVVIVGSTTHYDVPAGAKFNNLDDFNSLFAKPEDPMSYYLHYGYTKLATILFTKELQRKFNAEGVPILVMNPNPGGVASDGAARYLGGRDSDIFREALTPAEGALTILFTAAHPEPVLDRAKYAGAFVLPFGGWKEASQQAQDPALAAQLWEGSEALLKTLLK